MEEYPIMMEERGGRRGRCERQSTQRIHGVEAEGGMEWEEKNTGHQGKMLIHSSYVHQHVITYTLEDITLPSQ